MTEAEGDRHYAVAEDARNLMLVILQRLQGTCADACAIAVHVKNVLCEMYDGDIDVADVVFTQNGATVIGIRADVSLNGKRQRVSTHDFL